MVAPQSNRVSPGRIFNLSGRDSSPEPLASRSADPDAATTLASLKEVVAAGDYRLDAVLRAISEAAQRWTGASGAAIAMWKDGAMVCRARSGETSPPLGARLSTDAGISGECLRTGNMQHCVDTENDPLVDAEVCRALGLRSIAVLPIQGWRGVNGILEVFSTSPAKFSDQQLAFLQQLTALAERARASQPYGATPASKARAEEPPAIGLQPASDRVRDVAAVFLGRRAWQFVLGGVGLLAILLSIVIWLGWRGPAEASQTRVPPPVVSSVVPARRPDNESVWGAKPGGESVLPSTIPSKTSAGSPVKLASKVDIISPPKAQPDRPLLTTDALAEAALPHSTPTEPLVETVTVEPPSPAVAPDPAPSESSSEISTSRVLYRVAPSYPAQALLLRLQGKVILDAVIFEDGTVHDLKVAEGNPVLARSATEAIQRWRYKPSQLDGHAVKTQAQVTVTFRLPSDSPTP